MVVQVSQERVCIYTVLVSMWNGSVNMFLTLYGVLIPGRDAVKENAMHCDNRCMVCYFSVFMSRIRLRSFALPIDY